MRNKFSVILSITLLLIFSINCSLVNEFKKEFKKPVTVYSKDNLTQLTVPGTWMEIEDADKDIALRVEYMLDDVFVYVISVPKTEGDEISLDDYTETFIQDIETVFKNPQSTQPKSRKINNLPAKQFLLSGFFEAEKENIKQIYTIVEGKDYFHQVMTYSSIEKFEEFKPVFFEIISSFQEAGGFKSNKRN